MCGIAGILRFDNQPVDELTVRQMTGAMAHRGPDAVGFYGEGPVALGHLRLSILDLSESANQPFADRSGRYKIIFNGEIYNFNEIKARIPEYPFTTTGDTELLLAAYIKWGADCLLQFRGMFAFAIWDSLREELFLARDPMGVKPLYYYKDDRKWIFASEVRGILASGLVERKLSQKALVEYFSYQSVSYPFSPVEGVLQLQAGSWLRLGKGVEEKGVYWDAVQQTSGGSGAEADWSDVNSVQKKIRELMLTSVQRRLISDVPVGAFLSGGIDSSAVVGLMAEAGSARPNTFTIAFEEKEFDESGYAEMVAKKFNTHHSKVLLKSTVFLDELQNALNAMDTPSGDGVNTYVVSKEIRRNGMTVALSGAGGDELFAGYPFFDQYLRLREKKILWMLPGGMRRMLAGLLSMSGGKNGKIGQILELPAVDITHLYPIFRQLLSPGLLNQLTGLRPAAGLVTAVEEELSARQSGLAQLPLLSQVSAAEYLGYTQHTLLKDTDQMSMASSLEVREPYFDLDLISYVLSIPDKLKKPIYPKSLLVESLKPLLPDEIVHRKKQGFLFPWELWLKKELRPFAEQHINNIAEKPFIKGDQVRAYWQRFVAGDKQVRWQELWLFIVLDYWMEKNQITC